MAKLKMNECCIKLKEKYEKLTPEQKVVGAGIGGLLLGAAIGVLLMRRK